MIKINKKNIQNFIYKLNIKEMKEGKGVGINVILNHLNMFLENYMLFSQNHPEI